MKCAQACMWFTSFCQAHTDILSHFVAGGNHQAVSQRPEVRGHPRQLHAADDDVDPRPAGVVPDYADRPVRPLL